MMRILILATAALLSLSGQLWAAPCFPREDLIQKLENSYGEERSGSGLQSSSQVLDLWASPETGTFTIFITMPNGISCIIATGEFWQDWAEPVGDPT